jgi:putative ABC transport system permease protein
MMDVFLMSLDALRTHKIRTLLTLLGIIIGISSVIMVSTAGTSVERFVEEKWNIFDPTGMIVGIGAATDPPRLSFNQVAFTDNDIEKIQNLPHVKDAAPVGIVAIRKISIRDSFLKWRSAPGGTMYSSSAVMLDVLNLKILRGRIFEEGKNEIVMTESTTLIFGKDKPLDIDDTIYLSRLDGRLLKAKIVGILKEAGDENVINQIISPTIIGPVDPYYSNYIGSNVGGILNKVTAYGLLYITATDKSNVENARNEILDYLNSGSSEANKYKDKRYDFVVITQEYIISKVAQVMGVINMLITTIALISLGVGGIGIANIMFATVTERTREIGTMMAIGAKRRHIMQLFLYQSTIIGLIGGLLGCILGASGSAFVVHMLNNYVTELGGTAFSGSISLIYPMEWFGIAVVFGLVVGIVAGVLPARKAAKMDPVVALRYS